MDEIQLVLITLNPDGTDTKLGHMVLVLYKSTKQIGVEIWNTARLLGMERLSLGIQDLFAAGVSQAPREPNFNRTAGPKIAHPNHDRTGHQKATNTSDIRRINGK
ncbi:hypothetical protein Bbelb_024780 [Branchiostoma belcheri]|nr:hypothetical protein Bbelb_024780 [Branchiostoma belcheri]